MADKNDNEDLDDFIEDIEDEALPDVEVRRQATAKQRDWRDLERYKAERELKKLMEDDWLDDL